MPGNEVLKLEWAQLLAHAIFESGEKHTLHLGRTRPARIHQGECPDRTTANVDSIQVPPPRVLFRKAFANNEGEVNWFLYLNAIGNLFLSPRRMKIHHSALHRRR